MDKTKNYLQRNSSMSIHRIDLGGDNLCLFLEEKLRSEKLYHSMLATISLFFPFGDRFTTSE